LVLTADDACHVRLWDAQTGEAILPPLKHPGRVGQIGFSPDGRQIISACVDRQVRVWTLVPDSRPVEVLTQWASVLYGRQIDRAGGLTPIAPEILRETLEKLR
jgi:WD40 repeat protein